MDDEYLPRIPDQPEYDMVKAAFLGRRGYGYHMLEEYKLAIADFMQSIKLAEKMVDESSPELSVQYERLSISYEKTEQLDLALEYMEKMIPIYRRRKKYLDFNGLKEKN